MKNSRWKKSFSVIALVCCMLLSLLPVPVLANPDSESLVQEVPGDAIILSTPEDVLALAENCRVNTWSVGKTVALANDINMTETDFQGIPTFGGTFLGQGYKINGLNFVEEGSVVGLFRYLQKTAVVNGLSIEGLIQPKGSKSVVGGIAGNNAGTIRNCTVNCLLSGYEQIGGIAGINEVTGVVENCIVTGVIYGNHFVGGFVGENHGVVRNCANEAEINTQSVQNSVSIEDITIDSMINTESAYTTTDIGGVVGINSGVIRACTNKGAIGYQSMGYNVGGIVGTQNGYVVDCVNYADVQGRKEVGGIVGHMEPNIVVNFTQDSLQELSTQMDSLNSSVDGLKGSVENSGDDINNQVQGLEDDVKNVQNALDVLTEPLNPDAGEVDTDKINAATNDLSNSLNNVYSESTNIQKSAESATKDVSKQLENMMTQLEEIQTTVDTLEEGINFELEDVSGADTDADTIGKVANCINYGDITGDMNVGGIAGIMAEENDLDDYNDTSIYGSVSMNVTGQARVVVRDCRNTGTVSAGKQYAGGIAGYMMMGAVLESINTGNMDALSADYVGGIAGGSEGIIRDCSSKSILAGDTYVGGIAGQGNEVRGCHAFVCVEAHTEKAGAILGYTSDLPDGNEDVILGNYYYVHGENVGGIDGISYAGATTEVDLTGFLQLPNLDAALKTANIRFLVEGQDVTVLTVNVGESLSLDKLPALTVESGSEYDWEYIPAVTSEVLDMGETATVEYISEELLTNILFDQTYEAVFDSMNTVISGTQRNDKNLTIILAEGTFAKHTTLEIVDALSGEAIIDGQDLLVNWNVQISNEGVRKLHYLIPEDANASALTLYIKGASGKWVERAYTVDGSYIVFDFADGEQGFALCESAGVIGFWLVGIIVLVFGMFIGVAVIKKNKKQQSN